MKDLITNAVAVNDGKITTTSLKIAEVFGKRHDNVIQAIESLQVVGNWHKLNFQLMFMDVQIGNGATRNSKMYKITKDGFTLLAMGFTGAKAMAFKIAYIEAFNAMEQKLRNLSTSSPKPTTKQLPDFKNKHWVVYNSQLVINTNSIATLTNLTIDYVSRQMWKLKPYMVQNVDYIQPGEIKMKNVLTENPESMCFLNPKAIHIATFLTISGLKKLISISFKLKNLPADKQKKLYPEFDHIEVENAEFDLATFDYIEAEQAEFDQADDWDEQIKKYRAKAKYELLVERISGKVFMDLQKHFEARLRLVGMN